MKQSECLIHVKENRSDFELGLHLCPVNNQNELPSVNELALESLL